MYKFLKRFQANEEGNIFILFAFGLVFLVAIAGAGVDLGRQQLESVELQQAADAASLAGASISANKHNPDGSALTQSQITSIAGRYFSFNYQGNEEVEPRITLEGDGANANLRVDTGTQSITTSFVNQIGTKSLAARGVSVTNASRRDDAQPYEVMLTIDVSGSMSTSDAGNGRRRIEALQTASKILIDDILPPENESLADNIKNRMGGSAWGLTIRDEILLANADGSARANQNAVMTNFVRQWVPSNLSPDGTNSTLGLNHALATFTASKVRPTVVRAVVLLTDGQNNIDMNGDGSGDGEWKIPNDESRKICDKLKAMGPTPIVVYTIGFGKDLGAEAEKLLADCATPYNATTKTQYFFLAATETELQKVFTSISGSIRKIRIVQ